MVCKHCGTNNTQGMTFCVNCGADLPKELVPVSPAPVDIIMPAHPPKSPAGAAVLSFLLVGVGHIYIGQSTKGITLLGVALFFAVTGVLAPIAFIMYLANILDAYLVGKRLASGRPVRKWEFFFN